MKTPSHIVGSLAYKHNFKAARLALGLTQPELAARLHTSAQTISNYESGRAAIPGYRATCLRGLLERAPEPVQKRTPQHEGDRRSVENGHSYDPIPSLEELFS